jgi:hypothetical protein
MPANVIHVVNKLKTLYEIQYSKEYCVPLPDYNNNNNNIYNIILYLQCFYTRCIG